MLAKILIAVPWALIAANSVSFTVYSVRMLNMCHHILTDVDSVVVLLLCYHNMI